MTKNAVKTESAPVAGRDGDRRTRSAARSRSERRGMRSSMRLLEDALTRPASGRTTAWTYEVALEFDHLRLAMREHVLVADAEDGLLLEILEQQPRLEPQIKALHDDFEEIESLATSMRATLDEVEGGEPPAAAETRHQLRELLGRLRSHQSLESDVIWEAFALDIGVGG